MNKEELFAISKSVFGLSISRDETYDLDILLERLFTIFLTYPDLPLDQCGAIVLINQRGRCFQVAQFGMAPAWKSDFSWKLSFFENATVFPDCQVRSYTLVDSVVQTGGQQLMLLPLSRGNQFIGYTALFAHPLYQPSASELDFMTDLSRTLSGLVHRAVTREALNIRDIEIEESRKDAIRSLGVASQYRDDNTGWHLMRMTNYAMVIAKALGIPANQMELLNIVTPMHDVGKIGIPDAILHKPDKLTPEEFDIMKMHTEIGVTILAGKDPIIAAAREIAESHHERWDGTGYPNGLAGDSIPLLARICAVADVFDALTSARPYKKPWDVMDAKNWIIAESGKHFDPAIVCAFEIALPEIMRIKELYRDDIIDPNKSAFLLPMTVRENSWVEWDDILSVGIDTIDEHHRYLFDLINELFEVVSNKRGIREVARLIKATDAYAKVHFHTEEQMMRHYGYEGIHRQERQHREFESRIREFYEELHDNPLITQFDAMAYLRDWLVHHIRVEDAQLRSLVRGDKLVKEAS